MAAVKTIGQVAELSGVTIRTLRHYDEIGLLKPLARSEGGYRLYGREELLRLREILIWRRLGFPLGDIAALTDEPDHDLREALERQLELASSQLHKFQGLMRGLRTAIAAVSASKSLAEHDVFAGFAGSLSEEAESERQSKPSSRDSAYRISPFALLSGRSQHGTADGFADALPRRIVATEPIRIGENLLALGILPVGAGSFFDPSAGGRRFCPWPKLIEAPIRELVKDIGWYGTDKELIAAAQPDLILDLRFSDSGESLSEEASGKRCSHDDLCEIAPTALFEAPIGPPGFLGRIEQLATALRVEDRVEPLLASWHARTRALREHVAAQTVSALNTWCPANLRDESDVASIGLAPNLGHEGQVFTALGLELVTPSGEPTVHHGGAVWVTAENVGEMSAPTLFLTVDSRAFLGPVHRVVSHGPLASLPAARRGRVFDFRWLHTRSGWFTAHWQLGVIARAFGVSRLRTAGSAAPVHLAVVPEGKAAVVSTVECGAATLSGPGIPEIPLELEAGVAAAVDLGDVAGDVCAFPEGYSLRTERSGARRLTLDRESALERLAQRRPAA